MNSEKYTNDAGKECYRGMTEDSEFSPDLFHKPAYQFENDTSWALHTNLGTLTYVHRLTGFGWWDQESGFRDKDGGFWLASGGYNVKECGCKTLGEAIQWVKDNANTCIPSTASEAQP